MVSGAVYLITLFLFIPVPFINSFLHDPSFTFNHQEVWSCEERGGVCYMYDERAEELKLAFLNYNL